MGGSSVLMAAALMAAAWGDLQAPEAYGDLPAGMELMYPEQNYEDQTPESPVSAPSTASALTEQRKYEEPSIRRLLMYKMMQALRNRDAAPNYLSVPKWIPSETVIVPPDMLDYAQLKAPLFKRDSSVADGVKNRPFLKPGARPQQKWKIKKGKAGPHMICYFKLCAFRPT